MWQDMRYGARALRKQPAFALAAVLTLALGIGAYTAIFSLVNSIVLKPLPYPRPEELVSLSHVAPGAAGMGNQQSATLGLDVLYLCRAHSHIQQHRRVVRRQGDGDRRGRSGRGPQHPRVGRCAPGARRPAAARPCAWRRRPRAQRTGARGRARLRVLDATFGGDASVIGRKITVNSTPREVVGVMPKDFRIVNAEPDLIAPIAFNRSTLRLPGFGLETVARLKPTVTIAEARADVARMVPIWMRSWPMVPGVDASIYETWRITPALHPLATEVVGNVARVLLVLFGAIGIVLLVACANVAALMLVRMEARQSELAVRAALGAGRWRIVRALLVESTILALAGGALGVGLAAVSIRLLVSHGPDTLLRLHEIALDAGTLGFAITASLLSGALFGVLPALRYTGPEIAGTLHAGGRTASDSRERRTTRHGLIVVQIALALVLLVASGLMIRTFQALLSVEPGFTRPEELQTIDVAIPGPLVSEPERVARLQHDIADRLSAIAGVTSVGFASVVPMVGGTPDWDVIVSENMARESWGSAAAAIGKRVQTIRSPWREVVGVVQDVHEHGADVPTPSIVYWPTFGESPYQEGQPTIVRNVTFTVRSAQAGREDLLASLRRTIWSANASLAVANERTMKQIYDKSMERVSFTLVLLALAGLMALALGVIGIYGAIAYAVIQQTRDIGIRVALGASPGSVTRMFVRRGVVLTGAGAVVGLISALALTRVMSSLLFGIRPLDPLTYVAVSLLLIIAAVTASYIPARKASALGPVKALRAQ